MSFYQYLNRSYYCFTYHQLRVSSLPARLHWSRSKNPILESAFLAHRLNSLRGWLEICMQEVCHGIFSGSTPLGDWRNQNWAEVECPLSCNKGLNWFSRNSGDGMALQNHTALGQGSWAFILPHQDWMWACPGRGYDLGRGISLFTTNNTQKGMQQRAVTVRTPNSSGYKKRKEGIQAAHHSMYYKCTNCLPWDNNDGARGLHYPFYPLRI